MEAREHEDTGLHLSGIFRASPSVSSSSSRIGSFLGWPPEPLVKEHKLEHCMRNLRPLLYGQKLREKGCLEICASGVIILFLYRR